MNYRIPTHICQFSELSFGRHRYGNPAVFYSRLISYNKPAVGAASCLLVLKKILSKCAPFFPAAPSKSLYALLKVIRP